MNDKIKELADKISEAAANCDWSIVNTLQKVLDSLVKLEIAAIQGELPKSEPKS